MEENQFCRLCLIPSAVYFSLLKNNGKEMLLSLTGIELNDESSSNDTCAKCWLDLKLAYHIQQGFVEADKKFQLGNQHSQTKEEIKSPKQEEPIESDDNNENVNNYSKEENKMVKNEEIDITDDEKVYPEVIYIQTDDDQNIESSSICPICGINYQENEAFYQHVNTHYNKPLHCEECLLPIQNISAYRDHIELKHPNQFKTPYTCDMCQLSFRYKPLYDLHIVTVHPTKTTNKIRRQKDADKLENKNENLKCDECNKVLRDKATFKAHVKGHIKKPCPICGVNITIYNLSKHVSLHKSEPAVCHLCGITSKNFESLRGHMYYTHSQRRLKCEECGKEFKKLYCYKMHIKKEHTGERSFTCDTCGKRFFTNYELNNHIRSRHLKQRPHICQFCQKGFASRFSLRTHERQHTNEAPYICEVCGEGFRQNVSLRAHRKSRHNIIESKNTQCPVCGKMFVNDWALRSHTRSVHD
ncbi:hypothetical protein GWI33_019443 [Rhynchophorus ferrugineus]|uniref:C2H2-type domain-containing protein n=1 Tax=Rhynchophorus ferrugineus TaxID=354439 RepID=A0A834HSU6_RHYFE|nr:hypothetical protein GWI33_019443 [Rhynchophorus ferrugineus]